MKLKLHFFLIYIIALKTYSQNNQTNKKELPLYNLYYLSKYIVAYENLDPNQAGEIYNVLFSNIGEKVNIIKNEYNDSKDPEKAKKMPIGAFLNSREIVKNQIRTQIYNILTKGDFTSFENKFGAPKNLEPLESFYNNNIDKITLSKLNKRKTMLDSLNIGYQTKNDSIINKYATQYKNDSATKDNISKDNIVEKITAVSDSIDHYKKNEAIYFDKIIAFTNDYVKDKTFVIDSDIQNYNVNDSKLASTEINLNSTVQTFEQRAATSTYKLPSESDMINAMAMFLAKRAQQEMAIWFMDKIRENIKNPLVYEAFPETIKLIETLEDFKTPNFSLSWRYAIASDFVKMPKNLAKSTWIQNFIFEGDPKKIELFSTSVLFGYELNRLISEKYNYRDIIRYFYTNPQYDALKTQIIIDDNSKLEMNVLLQNSITILYILTNEFFAIDDVEKNKSYRLLSYEEIAGMNETQWIALFQLIQIKYGINTTNFDLFFKDVSKKDKLSKWIGNLLISLSQFDKVNKDYQKALDKKEGDPNYNFYNVWQNTLQIIDNLDYKRYLNIETQTNRDKIEILKQAFSIYENIQNKDYSKAIQKTLEIIKIVSNGNTNYNVSNFDLLLENKIIKFNADGKSFTCDSEKFIIDTDAGGCLIISDERSFSSRFSNFDKTTYILPFITNLKNDNYDIIAAYDPGFKTNFHNLSNRLKLNEKSLLIIINYLSFRNKTGWDSQKLFEYIDATSKKFQKNYVISDKTQTIKSKYQEQLLKLTAFFGDVLVAKNAEELSNVIDSYALPPTSYKLKRRVTRSVDLNAYVGLQGSRMWTNGFTSLKTQYTAGITAPIGFAYTWSTLKRDKPNNWGFTVDIVDLGNIVNHYLVNSTDDYTKDVHFSEVFSPAASFMYALRKTPIVVFVSFKLLPLKTSSITDENGTTNLINEKAFDASVLSLGFKIDIPLVNLWSMVK